MNGELVLVRHGETAWHADNRYAGRSDVALTARGEEQAADLAAWAVGAALDRVVASPLSRALRTAGPAAAAAGIEVTVDPRLVEVDFGDGDGRTRDEMADHFPDALAAFLARPASCPLPGGESGHDALARALPALHEHAARGGRTLVVAHQTLLRLAVCALVGIPPDHYRAVLPRLDNVATTTVRPDPGGGPAALVGLNVPTIRGDGRRGA